MDELEENASFIKQQEPIKYDKECSQEADCCQLTHIGYSNTALLL